MNITLYKFSKKTNSTTKPSGSVTSISLTCQLKNNCSIINPVIELAKNQAPIGYNYAYIPTFNRYYFINDIVYSLGVWVLSLNCDVLASFSTGIKNSNQYVLRAVSEYNTDIVDDFYPTKAGTSFSFTPVDTNVQQGSTTITDYFNRDFNQGQFVIGVVGGNTSGMTYYCLSYLGFTTLVNNLMNFTPSDMSDVSTGIAKSLADPLQYVTCCYWYPYVVDVGTSDNIDVKFGNYTIRINAKVVSNSLILNATSYVDLPKHPQTTTRGNYLNLAPYSEYTLLFNPFGVIPIDTTKVVNATRLRLNWRTDVTTGDSQLYVFNGSTGEYLQTIQATLGIPIRLSQITTDMISTAGSAIGAVGSLFALDIGGLFGNITSAVRSAQPQVQALGSAGSFLSFKGLSPRLYAVFNSIVDEDRENIGRPLCAIRNLSTLTGYVQIGNAHFQDSTATEEEINMITSYMSQGIYLEA